MRLKTKFYAAFVIGMALTACGNASEKIKPTPSPEQTAPIKTYDMTSWKESQPTWFEPAQPYRIIGNIYSVGPKGLAVYLIAGDDGHILIDGGMPGQDPQILNNIKSLGFIPQDIEIILNSHAHFDHSGGLAALKRETGASFIASEGDRSALEGGVYLGAEDNDDYAAPPVKVDRVLQDAQAIALGNIFTTPHLTPGHSRGCTSFKMTVREGGVSYDAIIFCSATVAGNRLFNPPQYVGIVEDYQKTFQITKDWKPDVFLAGHPQFFNQHKKREAQLAGDPIAFVDAEEFPKFMENMKRKFDKDAGKQKAALEGETP